MAAVIQIIFKKGSKVAESSYQVSNKFSYMIIFIILDPFRLFVWIIYTQNTLVLDFYIFILFFMYSFPHFLFVETLKQNLLV